MIFENIDKIEMTKNDYVIDERLIDLAKKFLHAFEFDEETDTEESLNYRVEIQELWKKYFTVSKWLPSYAADGLVSYRLNTGGDNSFQMFSFHEFIELLEAFRKYPEEEYFNVLAAMVEISYICCA